MKLKETRYGYVLENHFYQPRCRHKTSACNGRMCWHKGRIRSGKWCDSMWCDRNCVEERWVVKLIKFSKTVNKCQIIVYIGRIKRASVGLKIDFEMAVSYMRWRRRTRNESKQHAQQQEQRSWIYWRNRVTIKWCYLFPWIPLLLPHIFRFPLPPNTNTIVLPLWASIKLFLDIASTNFSSNTSSPSSHFSFILSMAISHWFCFRLSGFITNAPIASTWTREKKNRF